MLISSLRYETSPTIHIYPIDGFHRSPPYSIPHPSIQYSYGYVSQIRNSQNFPKKMCNRAHGLCILPARVINYCVYILRGRKTVSKNPKVPCFLVPLLRFRQFLCQVVQWHPCITFEIGINEVSQEQSWGMDGLMLVSDVLLG